jgi:quinol monooxygenase YgiN
MSEDPQKKMIDELRAQVSKMLKGLDPEMPIAATVAFMVNKEKEENFIRNSDKLTDGTRRLPGCNVFAYHERRPAEGETPPDSNGIEYLIYEDWETVRQFEKQWDSEHLREFQYKVGPLIVGPPDLRWYYGWSDSAGGRVPRTGQTLCYDVKGKVIPCEGTGQDGEYRAGTAWPTPRFNDNYDGTVTDRLSGLVWLKDADYFGEVMWEDAVSKARQLAHGKRDLKDGSNRGDWRLPNVRELFSLIDYGTGVPIIPQGHPFVNVQPSIYWTNTSLIAAPNLAWMMTLGIGPTVFDLKINPNRMWPVRGKSINVPRTGQTTCWSYLGAPIPNCSGTGQDGEIQAGVQWPDPRFTDNSDGTVTDNLTRLVWLQNADPFGFKTWQQALDECNQLCNGQYGLKDDSKPGDWRLPNFKEIESLVDYNKAGPCLPAGWEVFENVRPSSYWTSTSVPKAPSEAMFIILGVGPGIFESKEHPFFVWPVRSELKA